MESSGDRRPNGERQPPGPSLALRDAIRRWVESTLAAIAMQCGPPPHIRWRQTRWWERERGTEVFQHRERPPERWGECLWRLLHSRHSAQEYRACEESMRNDALVAGHIDKMGGTARARYPVSVDSILNGLLYRVLDRTAPSGELPEAVFNEEYDSLDRSLAQPRSS